MPCYGLASCNPERMKKSREWVQDAQPAVYCSTTVQWDVRLTMQGGLEPENKPVFVYGGAFKWENRSHNEELQKDSECPQKEV